MSETLSLFEQPELEEHWTPPTIESRPSELPVVDGDALHFYARYGLAAALVQSNLPVDDLSEATVGKAISTVVQQARNGFRMQPDSEPFAGKTATFHELSEKQLDAALKSVPKGKTKADVGLYLLPHLICSDLSASNLWKVLADWQAAYEKTIEPDKKKSKEKQYDLKRSYAPIAGDVNNGRNDANPPRGNFWDQSCALAATLTPFKPAAFARVPGKNPGSGTNTAILPDLAVKELHYFIGFFKVMQIAAMKERRTIEWHANTSKPNLKYRRPPLCRGNFPGAPDDGATFGAVGLLGAIGEWTKLAPHREEALRVLDSLQDCAIYLVSYDNTRVTRFNHHVVVLAKRGELDEIVNQFARFARLWADTETSYPDRNNKSFQSTYLLFHLAFAQFLERFTLETFRDFFAHRAEYPHKLNLVLEEYFMQSQNIPRPWIDSASRLGQHLNYVAYRVANEGAGELKGNSDDAKSARAAALRKEKSKLLIELETGIMSARNVPELFANLSQRAGRFTQADFPAESKEFMAAAISGEIDPTTVKHLLIAYMRLQPERPPKDAPDVAASEEDTSTDTDDDSFVSNA